MGGKRTGAGRHPRNCDCEKCKAKHGSRPVDGNVARKIKARVAAEETYVSLIRLAKNKVGIGEDGKLLNPKSTDYPISGLDVLASLLRYLDDRDLGKCVDTVNHLHDKPIQHEVTVKMSELIREVRERKQKYERGRT
jgi:hypothetical protein